ncbi:MAG: DUF2892 domain-containing protein [Bacteroidales bacterium]
MEKNIGKTDKVIRIILGLIIGAVGVYFQSWWGLVGLIPLLTAFTGTCTLYLPFGISTCSTKTEH